MHIPSALTTLSLLGSLILPTITLAGSLTPPGAPANGSGMPTLQGIYDQLNSGATATVSSSFQEPSSGPAAGTGKSLSDIKAKLPALDDASGATAGDALSGKTFWGLRTGAWGTATGSMPNNGAVTITPGASAQTIAAGYHNGSGTVAGDANLVSGNIKNGVSIFGVAGTYAPALAKRVNKTGQTRIYVTGDDGQYQYGIDPAIAPTGGITGAYNTPQYSGSRFTDNGNGTVTDNLTALIWLKNANCPNTYGRDWQTTLDDVATLNSNGTMNGINCNDTSNNGIHQTDWRLPNINELHSLGPTWPPGDPFTAVVRSAYWSSSSNSDTSAWYVYMPSGDVYTNGKISGSCIVWPVRSGE